jgi:pimeloyl-ACP methyl ester carboxylesterase
LQVLANRPALVFHGPLGSTAPKRQGKPIAAARAIKAPSARAPGQYLGDAEAAELLGPLRAKLPAEIIAKLEVPRVDAKWYLRERAGSIITLWGNSPFKNGRAPWLLLSPNKLPESVPETGSYENLPTDQPWRTGYYPVIADGTRTMGAFVAQLPPDFDAKNPGAGIKRIIMVMGSGDNHARSILGDFGGFSAPGTLLVAFDMPMVSVGLKTPISPGKEALTQGLAYMRETLGISSSAPAYVAGFSAGGAAAMVHAFQDLPGIKAAAALSPVIQMWNVHVPQSPVPATIPASPNDQFAKTSGRGTPFEQTLDRTAQIERSYFTPEQFEQLSPHHRIARGEMPHIPLLITNGTEDEMAQPVVRSAVEMASFNHNGVTLPVVFGAQDDQDGKKINVEGFADVLAHKPGLAAITVQGMTHRPAMEFKRPDGKTWKFDSREMMMRFFLELEKQS